MPQVTAFNSGNEDDAGTICVDAFAQNAAHQRTGRSHDKFVGT